MDRVRFAIGTSHVFQGFHAKGDGGRVGAHVWLTAPVLADVIQHIQTDINSDEWNRVHNAPETEMDLLAFGGDQRYSGVRLASDGFTPLYPLTTFEATIVQRYDPTLPMREGTNLMGRWVHEDVIDSIEPWQDMEPGAFKPVTHGFVIDPQMVAEGRTDCPLILCMADIIGPPEDEGEDFVVDVYVPIAISVRAAKGDHQMAESMANEALLSRCNIAIGQCQDDPDWLEKAATYLRKWQEK